MKTVEKKLVAFIAMLSEELGHPGRKRSMKNYITGLLMNGQGKNMEAMAARLVADSTDSDAMRQRLQHFITTSNWGDEKVRKRVALHLNAELRDIKAFAIDDTGFAKKGEHSVGVARQYSGTLARIGNCQVAPSLHLVSETNSVGIGMRLYLPKKWAEDPEKRAKAGIPEDVKFQTKWQIGLDLVDEALSWGLPERPVLSDAGYGDCVEFRHGLDERGLSYAVGVSETTVIWRPGQEPRRADAGKTEDNGRNSTNLSRTRNKPLSVAKFALERGRRGLSKVTWRQGSKGPQTSRFGFVRVHTAHNHQKGKPPDPEQWLIYEWPSDEDKPTKFWLATLPVQASKRQLVRMVKVRWRIERDYQDMKQEVGLDEFQGRKWRGFHHHTTACMAAHAFLALNRVFFPPQDPEGGDGRGLCLISGDSFRRSYCSKWAAAPCAAEPSQRGHHHERTVELQVVVSPLSCSCTHAQRGRQNERLPFT